MALRDLSAALVVAALTVGLLAVGCTPGPSPSPPASPTPSASASASPSLTETAEERRQREAFAAAEGQYRRGFEEAGRLAVAGGVEAPTDVLEDTMTGQMLRDQMEELRSFKADKLRASTVGTIGWVRGESFSQQTLRLEACEDYRNVTLVKKSGETEAPDNTGSRVYRQILTMQWTQGRWKASKLETAEQLRSCAQ